MKMLKGIHEINEDKPLSEEYSYFFMSNMQKCAMVDTARHKY